MAQEVFNFLDMVTLAAVQHDTIEMKNAKARLVVSMSTDLKVILSTHKQAGNTGQLQVKELTWNKRWNCRNRKKTSK